MHEPITRRPKAVTEVLLPDTAAKHRGAPAGYAQTPWSQKDEPSLLLEYWRVLMKRRRVVALFLVIGAALGWLITVHRQPVYRARTSLDIQNLNENFMNMRAVDPTGNPTNYSAESYLQTQIKLLQSESVLARTIRKLKSQGGPAAVPRQDLLSRWRRALGFPASADMRSREAILEETAKGVKVRPMGMTRLVEITCESSIDSLAANFCNTMANEFITQSIEIRWDTAQKTSDWLAHQMADVRANLEAAEQRLQAAARAGSFYFDQEKESVAQERLRQVQAELSRAQADRMAKQAQADLVTATNLDSLPMVLDNGPLKEYQMKLTDLRRQLADLSATYTPDHPKVRRVRAEVAELESSTMRERQNVAGRIRNELAAANQREQMLIAAYAKQEKVVSDLLARATQSNMLRREVDSLRQLYETLLQRTKEAGFASAMRSSTIRVVDPAQQPEAPVAPNRTSSTAAGLALGGLFGALFAFYRERSDRYLRLPSETRLHLHARELGVIPSASIDATARQLVSGARPRLLPKGVMALDDASGRTEEPNQERLELITWHKTPSLLAESYRMAMSSILFAGDETGPSRALVISSPGAGEGKTTVLTNLGIAMAETQRRVVLVDGDLRRPRLHDIFGLSNAVGLSDFLQGGLDAANCPLDTLARPTFVPNLHVLPSGQCEGRIASLLHSRHMNVLLKRLKTEFDVILIDSPPMLHMADARMLGHIADGVILVFRAGVTTRETALEAQHLFEVDGTAILGTVLNDFDPERESLRQHYQSYYAYQRREA